MRASNRVVVTDLDGCLLDRDYSYDAAQPALDALERTGMPLILCSSKTRSEMEAIASELRLVDPMIVENGGAIVFPPGSLDRDVPGATIEGDTRVLGLGIARSVLVSTLRDLADRTAVRVRGFADMSPAEVGELTGLAPEAAERALQRQYDEPFIVESEEALRALMAAAAVQGLQISHGGRFHHLTGGCDKGLAVRTLIAHYRRTGRHPRSIGLGDAETDLSLLKSVDRPIIVPRPDGTADPVLAAHLPGAAVAPAPGPAGWNRAVLDALRE